MLNDEILTVKETAALLKTTRQHQFKIRRPNYESKQLE